MALCKTAKQDTTERHQPTKTDLCLGHLYHCGFVEVLYTSRFASRGLVTACVRMAMHPPLSFCELAQNPGCCPIVPRPLIVPPKEVHHHQLGLRRERRGGEGRGGERRGGEGRGGRGEERGEGRGEEGRGKTVGEGEEGS